MRLISPTSFFSYFKTTDKMLTLPLAFSFFCVLVICLIFAITYNSLPGKLPLFYSLNWGPSQLVDKQQFLLLPGIIVIVSFINLILAYQLHISQIFLKRLLMLSLVLIDLTLLVSALKIIFIFI